jgi:2'-5' RNA ligase
MRTFIAIGLPPAVVAALEPALGALRQAKLPGLRPVATGSTHITLRFLGELSKSRLDAIGEALAAIAAGCRPFSLELDEVGSFPPKGPPGVLWLGLKGDVGSARKLNAVLEEALTKLGHATERRAFSPHITLARMASSTVAPDRMRALDVLVASPPGPAVFEVGSVKLMASELSREGPRYRVLATAPFGTGAGNA